MFQVFDIYNTNTALSSLFSFFLPEHVQDRVYSIALKGYTIEHKGYLIHQ